ncbi:hypothetical protein D0T50_10010 [Bacteroides sp. 214]|uniref:hypothetical protein n=1 Tax=Bacteroides sp. 214 TaxID=2302935 RepID=UPI0013D03085|nr:hypothetical protein [Bacteroides sp. 214]NDW13228.1 hypothetical protein [Bacteroides sp. 214]
MKKLIFVLLLLIGTAPVVRAIDGHHQHLSPEEFNEKIKAFITEKADLTTAEAAKFFPVYFELQKRKKELNGKMWDLLRKGKDKELTEAEYDDIMTKVYDLKIKEKEVEKEYYVKFKKILSAKKVFMVQRAEARFNRELIRNVNQNEKAKREKERERERKKQ